jgi:hypothetical protein
MKALIVILVLCLLPSSGLSQTPPAPVATPQAQAPEGPGKIEVVKPEDAQAEQPPVATPDKKQEETTPGAIVYVRPYPKEGGSLSEADYGAFQSTGFAFDSSQFSNKGVKTGTNQYCIEIQTYLVAKEDGLYQIAIDMGYDNKSVPTASILSSITLEGVALVNEYKKSGIIGQGPIDNRTVGAAKLSKGIYMLQVIAGVETNVAKNNTRFEYKMMIKAPGDLSFRAPRSDELVLKK